MLLKNKINHEEGVAGVAAIARLTLLRGAKSVKSSTRARLAGVLARMTGRLCTIIVGSVSRGDKEEEDEDEENDRDDEVEEGRSVERPSSSRRARRGSCRWWDTEEDEEEDEDDEEDEEEDEDDEEEDEDDEEDEDEGEDEDDEDEDEDEDDEEDDKVDDDRWRSSIIRIKGRRETKSVPVTGTREVDAFEVEQGDGEGLKNADSVIGGVTGNEVSSELGQGTLESAGECSSGRRVKQIVTGSSESTGKP